VTRQPSVKRVDLDTISSKNGQDQDQPPAGDTLPTHSPLLSYPRPWPDPLGEDAFRGLVGDFVSTCEPHTEADPTALAVQFLVAFGCAVNRAPFYRVSADQHRMNIFTVLVGATASGRKGTSMSFVRHVFSVADQEFISGRAQSGLSSGEGLIWAVRDPISKSMPIKKNGRIESYQDEVVDQGVKDKRLLVVEPEFARALKASGREGNTLSALIRLAWDGGKLQTLTKHSPATATDPHISIIGHITAEELQRNLDEIEIANGFANRFLWICCKRSKQLPLGGGFPEGELQAVAKGIKQSLQHARRTGEVRMELRAEELWCAEYAHLTADMPGMRGSLLARGAPIVLRLALIYAMLDQCSEILVEHLRAGLAVWRYSEQSVTHVFGDSTGDRAADQIRTALRESSDGMTRTDLATAFKSLANQSRIAPALDLLKGAGMATVERVPTDGRTKEVWRCV
jgi:hypothetical protein